VTENQQGKDIHTHISLNIPFATKGEQDKQDRLRRQDRLTPAG